MNQAAFAPIAFIFALALALGTWQVQHGKPASGLLLITFGLLGLARSSAMSR
jgi:hypothetical protein